MESILAPKGSTQEQLIDEIRLMSIAQGKLFDIQILNLKYIPLVVFGEDLENKFEIDCDKRTIHFILTGKADFPKEEQQARLEHLVKYVQRLIGNYEVTVTLNETKHGPAAKNSAKPRKKPNRKGKGRVPKVRKRK